MMGNGPQGRRRGRRPNVSRPVARAAQKAQRRTDRQSGGGGQGFINEAAALEQADELLARKDEQRRRRRTRTRAGRGRCRSRRRTKGRASPIISART